MQTRIDFTPEDEQKMNSAARWGTFIAAAGIFGAMLSLIGTALTFGDMPHIPGAGSGMFTGFFWASTAINALVPVVLGIFLWRASAAFRRVATSDDDDPVHLLRGFRNLRGYFMAQGILLLAATGLGFVGMAVMSFVWSM